METPPFSTMSFLVQPSSKSDYPYVVAAMTEKEPGNLVPIPGLIGAGDTPVAALLRLVTDLREREPSYLEASAALQAAMSRQGITLRSLAQKVDYSLARLNRILSGQEEVPYSTILDLANTAKVDHALFKAQLRRIQRANDTAKDNVA